MQVARGHICPCSGTLRAAPTQERVVSAFLAKEVLSSLRDHAALLLFVLRTDMLSGHPYPCPSHHLSSYPSAYPKLTTTFNCLRDQHSTYPNFNTHTAPTTTNNYTQREVQTHAPQKKEFQILRGRRSGGITIARSLHSEKVESETGDKQGQWNNRWI